MHHRTSDAFAEDDGSFTESGDGRGAAEFFAQHARGAREKHRDAAGGRGGARPSGTKNPDWAAGGGRAGAAAHGAAFRDHYGESAGRFDAREHGVHAAAARSAPRRPHFTFRWLD